VSADRSPASGPATVPLRRRSAWLITAVSLLGVAAFGWPLLVANAVSGQEAHAADAPWLVAALVPLLLALVGAELSEGSLDAKAVAMLGVLAAAGCALRLASGGVAGLELVFFLLLPAGRVFGRGFGLVAGAVTLFASALLTGGVGPWLPFQMLAAGWVGLGAGCLPAAWRGRREVAALAAYGAVAGLAYGLVMNLWFWPYTIAGDTTVSYDATAGLAENLRRFWAFHVVTSLGFDLPRAALNVAMTLVLGPAVLAALRRAGARAAFGAPVSFGPAPPAPARDGS